MVRSLRAQLRTRTSAFPAGCLAASLPDVLAADANSMTNAVRSDSMLGPTLVQKQFGLIKMRRYFLSPRRRFLSTVVIGLIIAAGSSALAQQFNPEFFKSLHWRSIGPFRGGRTRAVAGVPSQPNVFYMAQVNGGVWKTEDYGHTWTPIFD